MAERRMFAKTIVLSDSFLDMPMSSRCLYFTLGMLADDDGFVNSPKSVMRQCGATLDDMNILIGKKFIIAMDGGVIVIKHWRVHNYIQSDRYVPTKYKELKDGLALDENKAYTECIQTVSIVDTQDRIEIGKSKDSKERVKKTPTLEEISAYIKEKNMSVDPIVFFDYYEVNQWKDVKNWKQKLITWNSYEKDGKKAVSLNNKFHNFEERSSNSAYSEKNILDDFSKMMNPPED